MGEMDEEEMGADLSEGGEKLVSYCPVGFFFFLFLSFSFFFFLFLTTLAHL